MTATALREFKARLNHHIRYTLDMKREKPFAVAPAMAFADVPAHATPAPATQSNR